ncbi:MAG: hypothetical protein LBH81_00955 [Rickettsiales bacterium]|jgi:hypothetical protein|nr:hypothetical protein [Rickettsiales bacterium]
MNKFAFAIFAALTLSAPVFAASPRVAPSSPERASPRAETRAAASRAAAPITSPAAARVAASNRAPAAARPTNISRAAVVQSPIAATHSAATVSRAAAISRSATVRGHANPAAARAATNRGRQIGKLGAPIDGRRIGRAAEAAASDYGACKDSYSECMDQFCANASDTYKKCICSDKYLDLAAQKEALESAENSLQDFGAMNLNMIQMTEREVNAVLEGTEGERAAEGKTDESANAQKLNDILGSLGAGNAGKKSSKLDSLGGTTFSMDVDDIWSGGSATEGAVGENVRGRALFTAVNGQCQQMTKETCKGTNIAMVVSAYSLTVDADCQKFQAAIDKMRQGLKDKIREANLAMMNERLSDFENRNSQTAVECLGNVLNDFRTDAVCGANWGRCLDFTGQFINQQGEPIYTEKFADEQTGITSLLTFGSGNQTLLEANASSKFVEFLQGKKNFAGDSLRKCEQEADVVWKESLSRALMEIIQAQARKVEEVKDNCLTKLVECNEKQSSEMSKITEGGTKEKTATEKGVEVKTQAGSLAGLESCKDIQRACEAIYGGDDGLLKGLLLDRQSALQVRYCEDEKGGHWHQPDSSKEGVCIMNQVDCEKAGLYWIDREGALNEFQQRARDTFRAQKKEVDADPEWRGPIPRACVSFDYYCGNFEAATAKASTPSEGDIKNGNICNAPNREQCEKFGFPWIGNKCVRNKYDCDAGGKGIVWYKGRCWLSDEASKRICEDIGGKPDGINKICNIAITHRKPK